MKKRSISILLCIVLLLSTLSQAVTVLADTSCSVVMAKTEFKVGEHIEFEVTDAPSGARAFLYHKDNTSTSCDDLYLDGQYYYDGYGMYFPSPDPRRQYMEDWQFPVGEYIIVIKNSSYQWIATAEFEIVEDSAGIEIDSSEYIVGDTINVTFEDGALVDTIKLHRLWWDGTVPPTTSRLTVEVTSTEGTSTEGTLEIPTEGTALEIGCDYSIAAYYQGEYVNSALFSYKSCNIIMSKDVYEAGEYIEFEAIGITDQEWIALYTKEKYDVSNFSSSARVDFLEYDEETRFPSLNSSRYTAYPNSFPFPPDEYVVVVWHGSSIYDTAEFTIIPPSDVLDVEAEENGCIIGDIIDIAFNKYSELDTVKIWAADDETQTVLYEAEVSSYEDVISVDTTKFGDGAVIIGAFKDGECIDTAEIYVEYTDMNYNDNNVYVFEDGTYVEFSEIPHKDISGKLFIGWIDEDGNAAMSGEYNGGAVFTAKYIDFDNSDNGDWYIAGVNIKNSGSQHIRYTFRLFDEFMASLPNSDTATRGAIAIEPELLNNYYLKDWADLELGRTYYLEDGTQPYTADEYTLTKGDSGIDGVSQYSFVIDVAEDDYDQNYTARGYIKFTDLNGIERIAYTEEYQTSVYTVAGYTLTEKSSELNGKTKTALSNIVEAIQNSVKEKYDTEKTTVVGSSDNLGTWIYQLSGSNLMVREAVFDSGLGGDSVEIVQISDTHFNFLNEEDIEKANPQVLAVYEGRDWLKNALSVPQTRTVLDYAKQADQIMHTGDAIDYVSMGNLELMQKEINRYYPTALVSAGNHDLYLYGESFDLLQSKWNNDIMYSSKVIKNKVMVIQLNNGANYFYDEQIAPLKADLALAREKGYTVLMFWHIPIYTGNSNESAVSPLRCDSGNPVLDFYQNSDSSLCGKPSDTTSATAQVIDIVKNNADIIKGVFNGHNHNDFYTEIIAKTADGEDAVIPQYTLTGSIYNYNGTSGHVLKITVK